LVLGCRNCTSNYCKYMHPRNKLYRAVNSKTTTGKTDRTPWKKYLIELREVENR